MTLVRGFLILISIALSAAASAGEPRVFSYRDTQDSLFGANLNQTKLYRQMDCAQTMTALVAGYFEGAVVEVYSHGKRLTLDPSSLQFCGVDDLDQGSFNIERGLILCADVITQDGQPWSASVFAKTEGDMFCEGERLLSVEGIWVH